MTPTFNAGSIIPAGLVMAALALAPRTLAQVRGVYPQGMNATNSGVTAEPGFTYSNLFILFSRDHLKGLAGETLATGQNSVMMDMNSFVWVSGKQIEALGGARFSCSATLPIANNSLSSDAEGALSGGGGFADSFYQPFILGWQKKHADFRAVYGFLAPTGRFDANENNNVGSGYWTHVASVGETFYLTEDKGSAISAFQMYEFHGTQQGTNIHPGENINLDYSITHAFEVTQGVRLQLGLIGYGQWQLTDKTGPTITLAQTTAHYKVNALGFASNVMMPGRKVSLGAKYYKEFLNRSTFQGYSLQISAAISF